MRKRIVKQQDLGEKNKKLSGDVNLESTYSNPDMLSENQGYGGVNHDPLEVLSVSEDNQFILEGLSLLSVRQRQVFNMVCDGKTLAECGRLLGIKKSVAQKYLEKARTKMRIYIGNQNDTKN